MLQKSVIWQIVYCSVCIIEVCMCVCVFVPVSVHMYAHMYVGVSIRTLQVTSSLNMIIWRCTHFFCSCKGCDFILLDCYIKFPCMDLLHFLDYFSADGVACITSTVDSSAVNADVQVFLWYTNKEFPRAYPGGIELDHKIENCFCFFFSLMFLHVFLYVCSYECMHMSSGVYATHVCIHMEARRQHWLLYVKGCLRYV